MDTTAGKIIIDGNAAAALGCMFAGVTVVDLVSDHAVVVAAESMIDYMKRFRIGADGKATFAIVQAEDELAAMGMVLGAGWAGARSMTVDRRPGHFADGRVRRPRLLRRSAGRDLGHPARRPVHRSAHPHLARRHSVHCASLPRRHQAHPAAPVFRGGMFQHGERRLRSGRAVPDTGLRHVRPGPGNEQLDVRSVQVSGEADQPRQGAEQGGPRSPGRICALQGR